MNKRADTEPSIIVIFGITGDLSQRYLLPALYHLMKDGLLNSKTKIVGITRRAVSTEELLSSVELCIAEADKTCNPEALARVHENLIMHQMDLTKPADYESLRKMLDSIEDDEGVCMHRLYYLSIPSQVFGPVVRLLGEHGHNKSCQHGIAETRLLVEKPFGYDLKSAQALIEETNSQFNEDQIYRIDHYLAKETVQNILMFRYSNPLFVPVWDHKSVESIHIIVMEKLGVENRATFYEQTGALRDMIQSHLLQLLGLVTMELPQVLKSAEIHKNKKALLEQIEPVPADKISKRAIRAQYDGYKKEIDNQKSYTETYASLLLYIDNKRWKGVPIKLVTGKALGQKRTDITLQFRANNNGERNKLTFRIQPQEGIELQLKVKKPGFDQAAEDVLMDFSYQQAFTNYIHPDAYQRVLVDAIRGDHTLFATADEILAGWRVVQPVVSVWTKDSEGLKIYKAGSSVSESD